MVYRKENGVIVPYANNSGQNVAADISIIDKNGKVVSAGGTTNIQALVSKISDDTVELSSDLASVIGKVPLLEVTENIGSNSSKTYTLSSDLAAYVLILANVYFASCVYLIIPKRSQSSMSITLLGGDGASYLTLTANSATSLTITTSSAAFTMRLYRF